MREHFLRLGNTAWQISLSTLLFLSLSLSSALAQDEEYPPAKKSGVRITFLPPPLDGTLSLGIYDRAGKLVRSLHREATEKDFVVGLNGFITSWDGSDDSGHPMPAGKYFARGYAVGDIAVEGVAMHGNDWITDEETPRIRKIISISPAASGFSIRAVVVGEEREQSFHCTGEGAVQNKVLTPLEAGSEKPASDPASIVKPPAQTPSPEGSKSTAAQLAARFPGTIAPSALTPGKDGTIWLIDDRGDHREVDEFSADGELQRRLKIDPAEPQPMSIAPVPSRDALFLIEEKPGLQRVRGLALDTPAEPLASGESPVSTWKEFLSKTIIASDAFTDVTDKLGRAKPFVVEPKIRVRLLPNELSKNETPDLDVQVAIDSEGAYLQASEGLLLKRITETPQLKWAMMGREGSRAITVFQSDGAVVEEFKVRKLANTMAFDAGDYDWKPGKAN